MNSHKILVLGGGFAGLWSAVGAARMLDKLGLGLEEVAITLVGRFAGHNVVCDLLKQPMRPLRIEWYVCP